MKLNEFFDKVYVLNLRHSKQRWDTSSELLSKYNIIHERFEATHYKAVNFLAQDNILYTKDHISKPRTLGCAISHLNMYASSLELGYKNILILEDDFLINKNINQIFESTDIPNDYDILYFGFVPLHEDLSMWDYNLVKNRYNNNLFHALNFYGGYAYSPSIKVREEILEIYSKEFTHEVDHYLSTVIQPRGNSFAFVPQLFAVRDIISERENIIYDMSTRSIDSRYSNKKNYE